MEREAFLQRLRARKAGQYLEAEAPQPWQRPPVQDAAAAFVEAAEGIGAHVLMAKSMDVLAQQIAAQELPQPLCHEPDAKPFEPLIERLAATPFGANRDHWFQTGTGLARARAGAIATGSVMVVRTKGRILAASLVPKALILLLLVSELHPDIESMVLLPEIREHSAAIITGPSRSADIENDLTIGVHGPGHVVIALLDDRDTSFARMDNA